MFQAWYILLPQNFASETSITISLYISQDELGYAVATNSPRIVVAENRGLFLVHTVSIVGQLWVLPLIVFLI